MSVNRAARQLRSHPRVWLAIASIAILVSVAVIVTRPRDDLAPEELVRRSGEAMDRVGILRVESVDWPDYSPGEPSGIGVTEYTHDTSRAIRLGDLRLDSCPASDGGMPFTGRHLAPDTAIDPVKFEFLRSETVEGQDAWVVRYGHSHYSIDSLITVEDTEWIAKDTYLLIRQEREFHDTMGFNGQTVSVMHPVEARATDCPDKAEHTVKDLTPRTSLRHRWND